MRILFIILIAIIAFAAGVWYTGGFESTPQSPVTETPTINPPVTPQATWYNADENKIVVTSPQPGAALTSTFTVSGKARGTWYFEASFPLEIVDANGKSLKIMPVQAGGDWMTADFVPFMVQVAIPNYKGKATLILRNDNPSGLPENEASVSIPIVIQ